MTLLPLLRRSFGCVVLASFAAIIVAADKFPEPFDTEKDTKFKLMPAAEAAKGFQVPAGFKVSVFAAEPEVRNPIGMTWDTRGRLWIAENFTYAERPQRFELGLRDRVLIFEDRDGDGKPEKRTVFLDNLQRLTSVAVGLGGVWLMCPPQLLFVPDRNGDDIPDGPPEVVLDGFTIAQANYHGFANGLKWGPDGWLYGRCGPSDPGLIRRPDQPVSEAVPIEGGIWRYHPTRKVFETVCHGTTNPWGHDWDANGECFFVNTVNGHLWHMIPGAHYRRAHTISPNPLVYEPIEMCADHWHWNAGKKEWIEPSTQRHVNWDSYGGGHAHSGTMIYNGNQWPESYRGKLLTLNLHGRRANVEKLERKGSGYVGKHEPDMLQAADPFFRGLDLDVGPDGSVYIIDWSDTGECHENTGVHRNSGRIFRVTYGDVKVVKTPDFTKTHDLSLYHHETVPLNGWMERYARLEMIHRCSKGTNVDNTATQFDLNRSFKDRFLRELLARYTHNGAAISNWQELLGFNDEHFRVWSIRICSDYWPLDTVLSVPRAENIEVPADLLAKFIQMAREDKSALVRLTLASTLQRLPTKHRPALAAALLAHEEDASDQNIPFMIWYGLIPIAKQNPAALVPLAVESKIPAVRIWIARRLAEVYSSPSSPLNELLARTADKSESVRREVIAGMSAGFAGIRKAPAPTAWKGYPKEFAANVEAARTQVQGLDVLFGDGRALDDVRKLVLDPKADLNLRKAAMKALIEANPPELRSICEELLRVKFLNIIALQGLTRFDDPAVGKLIASSYTKFHNLEKPAVVEALVSRPSFAAKLLDLLEAGTIPRGSLSAAQVRQIRGFNRPDLTKRLIQVWGELRDSPKDKSDLIARLKTELTPSTLASADKSRGRAVFAQTCTNCHRLFGTGGEIGPDLTGAGRKDLDYLLSNIVDPSAVVNKDFQMTVLNLADGRVLNGIITAETDKTLTVQTEKERLAIAKEDVEKRTQSTQSLMPDALLQPLTPEQVRDLIAYLMADVQVEMPASVK